MLLRNPLMMIVMAFGVGCSEVPPSERSDPSREAFVETTGNGQTQHVDRVEDPGDDVRAEDAAAGLD